MKFKYKAKYKAAAIENGIEMLFLELCSFKLTPYTDLYGLGVSTVQRSSKREMSKSNLAKM